MNSILIKEVVHVAHLIKEKRNLSVTEYFNPKVDTVIVCGEVGCSHMISINQLGEQKRERRSLALNTLEARVQNGQIGRLAISNCDTHGGDRFPSTEAIDNALGYFDISDGEAKRLLSYGAYDCMSDNRLDAEIAKSLGLVLRTSLDLGLLGLATTEV